MRPSRRFDGCCAVVAEDDRELRVLLTEVLASDGFDVIAVRDGVGLLELLGHVERGLVRCDLVLTDLRMPGMTALDVLARIERWAARPPVVVATAFPEPETERRVRSLGALGLLAKPFDIADLRTIVWNAVRGPG